MIIENGEKMFDKLKKAIMSKNPNSRAAVLARMRELDGRHIKYVTERIDNVDEVVGRDGAISVKNDELILFSSFDIQFRCPLDLLSANDLMSLDGVVLSGPDMEHNGRERTVIAYYTYYRK